MDKNYTCAGVIASFVLFRNFDDFDVPWGNIWWHVYMQRAFLSVHLHWPSLRVHSESTLQINTDQWLCFSGTGY